MSAADDHRSLSAPGHLGLVAVIVQIAAVSQISLLGVSADLAPLIVASVGLLAGSIPGAVMGFSMGLFVDTALVQTLGIDSLLLIGIGYGAGRLRELRDPSHTLVPVAIGAAATAISQIGFSLIQFLLGVDAPVTRSCSCARSSSPSPSTPCWRCRSTRSCGASSRPRCRRTRGAVAPGAPRPRRRHQPALAPKAPRRRRRSPPAGHMIGPPSDDRRPPITPQLAWRVAILGGVALTMFAVIFLRLWFLQVLSGDKYLAEANDNRVRDITIQAPRGDVVDRNGTVLVDNRPRQRDPDPAQQAAAARRRARRPLPPAAPGPAPAPARRSARTSRPSARRSRTRT